MSLAAVADAVDSKPRVRARTKTSFYVTMSVFMTAIVLAGFWPSYYGALLRGDAVRPPVIHVHGAVFSGWMALLLAQVALAWRGRVQWHRRVGRWGIAYGFLVLIMGVVVGITAPVMHLNAGEWPRERAAGFLLVTMGDMVLFGSLFVAAVAYRRKPEVHKRLMLAATVALLFAAVSRINTGVLHSVPLASVIWLSPLLIGMAYDWYSARRVHAAYVVSIAWLFIGAFRLALVQSAGWQRIGGAILDVF
jgi:uncharacterized membrane protein YozB (DUF420 family)